MRTLPGAAGIIVAALYLTACDATAPNDDGSPKGASKATPAIAVAPSRVTFQIYAFAPQRDPPLQTLTVSRVGGGTLAWNAHTTASWLALGHAGGMGPGQLQVELNRAGMQLGSNGKRPQALTGTITVSAGGASQVQIPVSVIISYLPPIKVVPGGDPGCGKKCSN
jgi:hypothetical protein